MRSVCSCRNNGFKCRRVTPWFDLKLSLMRCMEKWRLFRRFGWEESGCRKNGGNNTGSSFARGLPEGGLSIGGFVRDFVLKPCSDQRSCCLEGVFNLKS